MTSLIAVTSIHLLFSFHVSQARRCEEEEDEEEEEEEVALSFSSSSSFWGKTGVKGYKGIDSALSLIRQKESSSDCENKSFIIKD